MSAQHVHFFFTLRDQLKLYHWQTSSYARHKAVDDMLKELEAHIDLFMEIYMGKYGRPSLTRTTNTIHLRNLTERTAPKFVQEGISYLQGPLTRSLKGTDADLANIRDEMVGNLHQLLYLFSLK